MKIKNALVIGAVAFGAYQTGVFVTYVKVIKMMMDEWYNTKNYESPYRKTYHNYYDAYKNNRNQRTES